MKNPLTALARMLGIGRSATLPSALSSLANRPLMMSRLAIDSLLSGFNAGGIPKPDAWREDSEWSPHGSKTEHLITIVGTVGILSVSGPLFQRFGTDAYWWGGQGYDVIKAAHAELVANPQVTHIVHDLDSPGGQCSGCFDAVDEMRATRGTKPITAVINDCAASACYALATVADRIVISRTGTAGSIGVIATHLDMSNYLKNNGLVYEFVTSGEKKADYSHTAPMSARARAELQAEVDRLASIFVDTVAANRGMDAAAIYAMEAGCFFGQGAIDAGLADEIGTLDSVVMAAASTTPTPSSMPVVAPEDNKPEAVQDDPHAIAKAELEKSKAELAAHKLDRAAAIDHLMTSDLKPDLRVALLEPAAAITAASIADRITHAKAVADLCAAVGDRSLSSEFITRHTNIEAVRSQLMDLKATDGPELSNHPPASKAATESSARKTRLAVENVYRNLNLNTRSNQ